MDDGIRARGMQKQLLPTRPNKQEGCNQNYLKRKEARQIEIDTESGGGEGNPSLCYLETKASLLASKTKNLCIGRDVGDRERKPKNLVEGSPSYSQKNCLEELSASLQINII